MKNVLEALNTADCLMASDAARFQAGYTRENAELAAIEFHGLTGEARESFLRIMVKKYGN